MEFQTTSVSIPCSIHPSETIQRVNIDINTPQKLCCFKCLLKEEKHLTTLNFKTIPELLDVATNYFRENKPTISFEPEVPKDYTKLISRKSENLGQLNLYIEEEKKKVVDIFNQMVQEINNQINEKKNNCLNLLNEQFLNLNYWFLYFEK